MVSTERRIGKRIITRLPCKYVNLAMFTLIVLIFVKRGRWYPTTNILANGSILVIGGEIGSNDVAQPNLEILPRTPGGNTVIELEWLARTDPWNLYPFVVVLPSGRIFVAYYNEARILNPTTFATFKVLPNIPGAVNNCECLPPLF